MTLTASELAKRNAIKEKLKKIEADYKAGKTVTKVDPAGKIAAEKNSAKSKQIMKDANSKLDVNERIKATKATVERLKAGKGVQKISSIDIEADSAPVEPSNDQLASIHKMCEYARVTGENIAALEAKLKVEQEHLLKIIEVDIPEAMKSVGLLKMTLDDGRVVEVKTTNHCSYKETNAPAVFAWLRKNGHGDIIKNVIAVAFGKGDDEKAEVLAKFLTTKKFKDWQQKQSIHAGTFKAFAREQLEAGNKLPKIIDVFPKSEAIIKEPKNGNQQKTSSTNKNTRTSSEEKF